MAIAVLLSASSAIGNSEELAFSVWLFGLLIQIGLSVGVTRWLWGIGVEVFTDLRDVQKFPKID